MIRQNSDVAVGLVQIPRQRYDNIAPTNGARKMHMHVASKLGNDIEHLTIRKLIRFEISNPGIKKSDQILVI
ncbi:hypothetical protein D3C75_781720 [compost metagenome]